MLDGYVGPERRHINAHKTNQGHPLLFSFFTFSSLLKEKMQSMLNLRVTHGVPLCLSGITNPLSISKEMEDHDRRRKAIRKQRSLARREGVHANHQEMGTLRSFERGFVQIKAEEEDGDRDDDGVVHDLSHSYLGLTAKAA